MATLSQLKQQYTYKTGVSSLLTENQRQTIMTHLQEEEEARRNQGGFFGGIGYAFEKLGLGFLSSIEGIWDYTAGGLAKLFGADEWAEQQFANDWVNYNHADEWFNPSEGWQFVGDVAGGIGTSLPAIATVVAAGAIAVASGGTLSPVAAALISGAVAGLGAAGNATKQAYRETGELGGKEFGYGALVGITEGAVEGLSAGIGAGTGQIVKGISKSFGKEVAETVTRQTIGKAMIKGFIGEAFEEGLSEILDPVWARMTYDPNAKNATLQEVGYAALVGGLSGAIMGGVDVSIRNVHSMSRGSTIVKEGKSSNVISMAEQLSTYESENHTGYEQFEMVNTTLKELQTSMQKTNGEIRTAKQRMLLGVLEQANTTAAFTPFIARSAENIVNNADVIAEKLTAYGIKDAQGNPVTFTAEQIRSGVDTKNTSTFVNALKTNSVLRALAVADATGRLSMDTAKFKDATLRGQQLSTQADLNQFIENATDVERQAVGERLGISDWNTLTNEQFQQKIVEFSQNGGVEAYQQEQATVRELQNIDPATAKKMPARLNLKKDGTVRYTNGAVNIAVTKNGDTYRIYDYDSGKYSKPLTQAEANRTIREIKKAQAAAPAVTPATVENQQATDTQGTQQQTAPQNGTEQQGAVRKIAEQLNSERQQTQEIDTYARKNVSDYAKLNEPNKSIIRSVIRQGRAAGIADADVLSYARVAAHTGINVVFDKSLCAVAVNSQTGEKIYSDGYYDPETNRFVVNPETTRTHEALLLHELTHAIYRTADGKLILERGVKNMSQAEKDAIIKRYSDVGHGGAIELMDEINAHYAEGVLTNKNTIEKLVAEKPKLKDRILSFFKKSSTAYEGDTKLSKSAKSLYNRYKKLFDSFSERNRQYNAAEYRHTAPNAETRYALQEALQQLGEYDETRKRHIESREGDTISRNYGDIVEFIKTAKRLPPVKRLHIGIISDATAKLVKTKTDVDIKNYDFVLASNFISHIFDSHGTQRTEMPRNQKAVTYANIENIIETVIAPDDVTLASDENGTALKFIKELDGKNVALTITSTKKSTLTLKSAWIIENSEGRTPSANATASARTSETSGRNLTTDSISENGKKVNRNGKKDGKRYALQIGNETAQVDIEETKNLVALHNLSEEKLLKVLQLGGFPMPSIAITKVDMGHSEYGDITVVFGRDTIDPQKDRRNKIYSRDGWTPTAPKVEYKPNDRALSKIHKKYSELVSKVGYDATRVLYNYVNDIERQLELHGGEIGIISELYDNTELMNLFLVDTGGELIKPIYKTIRSELSAGEVTYRKRLIDALGKDFLAEFEKTSGNLNTRKDFVKQHKERIVNALATIMQGKESIEETRENISNNFSVFALGNTLDKATSYLNNGGISVSTEYDATATQEAIRKATSKREYVSWVDKLFGGIEEKTGIYNGRDPYTNSGNRRSFEALHYEYTLENMVEAMLNAPENGGSGWHGLTLGQLQAKLAKEFKSIDEIRLNADNLTVKDEAAHEEFSENTRKMLSEITALMVDESKYGSDSVAYWTALDSAEMVVGEIADNRLFTLEKIAAYMKREYSKSYRYNDSIGNKILGLFEYVRRENSTDYFEAKPRRAVAFSEIKKVLIPETASEKLIKQLTARNIPYQVYDSSDNARTNAIKQMDDVRFALPETDSQGHTLTAEQRAFFKDSKVVDDKGRLLVVYHGTNDVEVKETWNAERRSFDMEYSPFTIFKKKWERQAGHFFGKDIDNAGGYGSRIYKCYLNIKNPLVIECNNRDYSVIEYNGQIKDTYEWAEYAKAKGYDGVIFKNIRDGVDYGAMQQSTDEYVVFQSNQIKNTDNTSPTWLADIRYAINPEPNPDANPTESDNSGAIGGLTRGQRAKFVANNTKFKVYSKLDATSVIDSIIAERLTLRDGQYEGVLSGKNRAEVIEKLFTKLNSTPEGYRIGVALDIADYIINNAVLSDMYETYNDDSYAMGVLSVMRRYMHGVNLSGIQSEIQYKFDRKNSINLVWGAKMGGQSPDVIAQELEGYGIHIEAINEAEQFFEMLELYERAREQVNQKAEKIMLTAIGSKTEIEQLRQEIARDVLLAYDKKGTPSKYAKLVEQYTKKIADLKKDLSTAYKRNTLTNRIIDGAAYLRDIANKRNYVGAEIFAAPELTQWLKQLSKIKYRSDLRKTGVRKILLDYGQFYTKDNSLLYDEKNPEFNYIDNNVIDALNFIRQNALSTKPLSMEELQAAEIIIASAKHLFNNYDQIIIEGKKAKISELATEGNEIIKKSKNRTNKTFFNKIYGAFNKIIEPRVVIKSLENFNPNGILTRAYAEVTRGETEAGLLYIELTNDIDTYIKKHKRFKNRLTSEYITVAGAELTVGQAISLYELSKRTQAQEGLYESGFSYIDKKGSKQTAHITEADITAMYDAFTDTDKGFIELVETFFNVASKQVKTDADMQILGYTNASDEFYYPIKRDSGTIVKNITDARSIMADWANVYNFSFNKDVKTGAKNKLFVTDVYSIVTRHAKQLSIYAKMTVPLKNFSQIYAKNIGEKTNVVSIRNTINEQVWGGAEGYLSKLFSDIQGRATSNSIIEKMRGAYAKYQLGANLKVIVSQITSYPTAGIMLDSGVMAKGFVMKTNWAAMDKYCPYARVRNFERGIVRAEGVVDKIGKVGDVLTKPIQWTDRFTIGRLWNACQLQVQKDTGLKYGTVENMQKAGDMLEEVIRLTQPNYTNTERSELMRSDSDIVRSFTMFTSVPLKQLSRLVESFGEYNALRSLIKSGDSDPTLSKRYKLAKKKIRRTLAAVTIANLMYVLVGQFFKFLYNNMAEDDEEGKVTAKSFFLDMLKDFGSTTIGMLPVVRDIYGYFVNGYEIESFTGDMLNSIISSAKSLFELATKAASGEEIKTQEYMSIFRNSLYSIGQVTGIPVRNINNTITGLVRRFSPSAAYAYTSLFYNPKYSTDIKAALKKGDYELAEMIMGMLLKDDRTGSLSSKATQKFIELYDAGYTVLPKSIGNTLTYNGETIQLTAAQQSAFKTIYSQANAEIEKLVNSAEFATLSAERQAKAIKLLYDAYYSKAQSSVLKLANDNKIILLSGAISPSTLAPHLSAISAIESDTDKAGNVINGSKKAKVIKYVLAQKLSTPQKLLLILSLGYTIKDGDIRGVTALKAKRVVARYITSLALSREEKTALAEKCGLTVKNGRIYAK